MNGPVGVGGMFGYFLGRAALVILGLAGLGGLIMYAIKH
jgi:hypothetical protein